MTVEFNQNIDTFIINTKNTTYAFALGIQDELMNLYWGPRLKSESDIPIPLTNFGASFTEPRSGNQLEYLMAGGMVNLENCLKVTFLNNTRDLRPKYENYEILNTKDEPEHLIVTLKDSDYDFIIKLHYYVFTEYDLIERSVELINNEKYPIKIERIFSALWNLPYYNDYSRLTHCHGRWAHECQVVQTNLTPGPKILESRMGLTSHLMNPWIMLDDGTTTEDHGDVYFGALKWSGSWKLIIQKTDFNSIRFLGGINDYDFEWTLNPGEKFESPSFIAGFTALGFGQASRILHDHQRQFVLPANHRNEIRKVIYNSWEVTGFGTVEGDQMKIASLAADLGVEIFVMDDGWFGKRNNDRAGLGDWEPNPEKFPQGLQPLIEHVHKLGMQFGLWFEPEMVNLIDTKLYKEHPDWVIQFPNRPPVQGRNQVNLNLALPEVKQYVFDCVDKILTKYPGISYIKWDCNKSICDVPNKDVWVKYVQNLYEIFDQIRKKHIHLLIENCSGGGGRVDMGIMHYFDTNWTSDNTNPHDRLQIQEGFTMAYTPKVMSAWVTDAAKNIFSLEYRFHSSMCGILGIGANLYHWTPQDFKEAKSLIAKYKQIRHIVQDGDLYRLNSPRSGMISAVEYVTKDKNEAVIFAFKDSENFDSNVFYIHPKNLDPTGEYTGSGIMGSMSGTAVMTRGVVVSLTGIYKSTCIHITRKN